MGIGRDFTLGVNEMAIFTLVLSTTAPGPGIAALEQYDPDSNASVFLSEKFEIKPTGVVPIPGALLLMGGGLARLALRLRLRK